MNPNFKPDFHKPKFYLKLLSISDFKSTVFKSEFPTPIERSGFQDKKYQTILATTLRKEIIFWQEAGEMILCLGDFNMHVGDDEWGVKGNNRKVSQGGRLLRQLLQDESRGLILLNSNYWRPQTGSIIQAIH